MSVGAVGFIHQSAVTNSMNLQSTYTTHLQCLQSEAHLVSSRTSAVEVFFFLEIVNVLRPLDIFTGELHRVSLTEFLTGF